MTWTTPKTWQTSDMLTAELMNEQLRDNLSFLRDAASPTGTVLMYAGATAPTGWLLCDGSAVSRTTYSDLYALVGDTYGAGDGSTTFNLPDMRGRTPIGVGTGNGLTARSIGDEVGAETHQLSKGEMPSHTHSYTRPHYENIRGDFNRSTLDATSTGQTGSEGGNQTHNNMQPSLAVNFMIKT